LEETSPSHGVLTVTFSAFMVTIGLTLAVMMLTIYFLRLMVYGLPPSATIISVFLPLGPTGQAGYSILLIGQSYKAMLPTYYANSGAFNSGMAGDIVNVVCICIAFVLWSLATMWLLYAVLAVLDVLRTSRVPFKVPFWGLIFPNVCRSLASWLSNDTDIPFHFRVCMRTSPLNSIAHSNPLSSAYMVPPTL
jgi:tellurite resistance protein TehA-like permease